MYEGNPINPSADKDNHTELCKRLAYMALSMSPTRMGPAMAEVSRAVMVEGKKEGQGPYTSGVATEGVTHHI